MSEEQGRVLSAKDFLSQRLQTFEVVLPDDSGIILIRELSGGERDELEHKLARGRRNNDDYRKVRAYAVAMSMVDESHTKMFDKGSDKDIRAINELSGRVLNAIFDEILTRNGMKAQVVEELEKN